MRLLTLLLCILCLIPSAQAEKPAPLDYSAFKQIPVLHEGRIKPLDSFARIHLKTIADKEQIEGKEPIEWLAETLFDPLTEQRPLIQILDPDIKKQFDLDPNESRFSLTQMRPGLQATKDSVIALIQQNEEELSPSQRTLIDIHDKATTLHNIHRSFSLIMPLGVTIPQNYARKYNIKTEEAPTYLDLTTLHNALVKDVQTLIKRKGNDPQNYTASEQQAAMLSLQIEQIRVDGTNNILLRIMPPSWDQNTDSTAQAKANWHAPWAMILGGQGSPKNAEYLKRWEQIMRAFRANDVKGWNEHTNAALTQSKPYASHALNVELWYNKIQPFKLSLALYGLALLFCAAAFLQTHGYTRLKPAAFWPRTALALAVTGNIIGITMRMIILERPPVSTLYESTIFVAAICGLIGLIIAHKQKSNAITFCSALLCLILLAFAPILIPRGESMEMLVAVLNTNFWLATHVVCITMGYGVCILAAGLAHITMALHAFKPDKAREKSMLSTTHKTALGALLLTTVGTVLGGIWADQSWGRFWGWDPKENGALLIVLWIIWVLHGRMSGRLKTLSFCAGVAALNIIVALAWFGVNLLGVGLHSYGFTSGLATGLGIFCTLQTIIIAGLWIAARKRDTT